MSTPWTMERVLQLAPDTASAKAGQGLASPRKWVSTGREADAFLWGECQGSGANPYQVRIDLTEPAFKCSCPSRKFPCKHALGLLLIHAAAPIAETAKPLWVEEWVASRTQRAEKKQQKAADPPKPVDAEAQAKRRAGRLDRVRQGLAATKTWIEDIVRSGIAAIPSKGHAFFDEPARRLIDAQAPGAARMIRGLGSIALAGADWQRPFLQKLTATYLMLQAFERLELLPELTAADALAAAGIPPNQEEVVAQPGVADTWLVLSQELEEEDRLRVQRTWLFGVNSNRSAMILHFAFGPAPLDATLQAGTRFDGELCFFPGNQLRAAVKTRQAATPIVASIGYSSFSTACAAFADALTRQPWLEEIVLPLQSVTPKRTGDNWQLTDADHRTLPTHWPDAAAWTTASISGGQPITLAAAFDGLCVRPLAVLADESNEYVPLHFGGVTNA